MDMDILWAKSPRDDQPAHSLLAHSLDVAACCLVLLEREPPALGNFFARGLGLDETVSGRWLALLAGLHDFGKATPAFAWKRGFEEADRCLVAAKLMCLSEARVNNAWPHGQLSQALLPELLGQLGWADEAARGMALAVGMHHGIAFRALLDKPSRKQIGEPAWANLRQQLFTTMVDVLELTASTPPVEKLDWPVQMAVAGLTSVADWVASSLRYGGDTADPKAYLRDAQQRCGERLDALGWHRRKVLTSENRFRVVFPSITTPRPLQQAMEATLRDAQGPTLLLVEAPMGEGKTEAALLAHCVLQARNGHRGLYFALPTQATGNAMFVRLQRFLESFGHGRVFDIQLVHGLAALNQHAQRLRGPVLSGVDDEAGDTTSDVATVRAAEWFSARKRALLSEYGVGTVDQALVGVLPARHHFVRLFGLTNRVVVIDEVHAYDAYTSGLIADLLRWLRALGSSAVVMSATLPAATRQTLLAAWGSPKEAGALPSYPRISRVDASGQCDIAVAEFGNSTRSISVGLRKLGGAVEHVVAEVLSQMTLGGCLLVLVNTVERAQAIFAALSAHPGIAEVTRLFHARFPAGQRQAIETDLVRDFGPDAPRRPPRAIVVATQVVEQSLDVDFDALISDLAPVDLLLQRLGRVHRHQREGQRPAHRQQPQLWVAGLAEYPKVPKPGVYPQLAVLRSAQLLAEREQLELPTDIDALVQACYGKSPLPSPNAEWDAALRKALAEEVEDAGNAEAKAVTNSIGAPDSLAARQHWLSDKEDDETAYGVHPALRVVTRLGADALRVLLVYRGPNGISLQPGGPPLTASGLDARALLGAVVPVSHRGLVPALRKQPVPDWVAKDPLLRGMAVLELDTTGAAWVEEWHVVLDARLGLRIHCNEAVSDGETATTSNGLNDQG